jgi:hypothetical protein
MREWETALASVLDQLVQCRSCSQTHPYPFWVQRRSERTCPFCGTHSHAPYPSVLELCDPKGTGFQPSRIIVVVEGNRIYHDTVEPTQVPPLSRTSRRPIGSVEWLRDGQPLALRNERDAVWTAAPSGLVPPVPVEQGSAVALQPELVVWFGPDRRMARVVRVAKVDDVQGVC